MGYIVNKPEFDAALQNAAEKYPFALVYAISDILLCRAAELQSFDWQQAAEARFFGPEGELHLLFDERQAYEICEDGAGDADTLTKVYRINEGRFPGTGSRLVVKQYLKQDADGQLYIALTRLADIRKEA